MKNELYFSNKDFKQHRKTDPTNRKFFYSELINLLNEYLHASIIDEEYTPIYATNYISEKSLEQKSIQTPTAFYSYYKSLEPAEKIPKKVLRTRGKYARS